MRIAQPFTEGVPRGASSMMPIRGIFPGCCARAARGHATAAAKQRDELPTFHSMNLVGACEQSGIRRFLVGDMIRHHIYFSIPWIGRHLCPDPVWKCEFLASVR
jgi:hypothetical protein